MYLFSHKDGWSVVEDYPFSENTEDLDKVFTDAGYNVQTEFIDEESRLEFQIYARSRNDLKYEFISAVIAGDNVYDVGLPLLPDLLEFYRSIKHFRINEKGLS